MIEKQALTPITAFQGVLNKSPSLNSARFKVVEGEFLRLYADVVDSIEKVSKRGALYAIRFYDQENRYIDFPYVGTVLSKIYGRFIYIRTQNRSQLRTRQLSSFIVAPIGATVLEVAVYCFEGSAQLRVLGEIQCFSLPKEPTLQHQWLVSAEKNIEHSEEVYSFWSSLFSFSIVSTQIAIEEVKVILTFLDSNKQVIDTKTSLSSTLVGRTESLENAVLIQPVHTQETEIDKQAQNLLEAVVQIVPPRGTVKVNVNVINQAQSGSLVVSYKLYKFANLMESRFDAEIFNSEEDEFDLSYEVADMTFSELLSKRARNIEVLDVALDFYKRLGTIERTVSTANHILNVITNRELYSKARLALSEVRASAPSWFPSPGKVEVNESAADKQLTVAHFMSTPDLDRICQKQDAEHVRAIAIMPLGYPKKGESGEPWERSEEEGVDCFFLNCVSAEQLELVPVTSQLNFMAVLAKDILRQEHVDLIHIHEDEASIDSLLVGVALAKAFKIPLVYQKHTVVDEVVTEFDETKHSLAQAKLAREYQCMQMADAIIVQSEAQRDALIKAGIQQQKISILPLTEDVAKGYMEVYELAQQTHLNKN